MEPPHTHTHIPHFNSSSYLETSTRKSNWDQQAEVGYKNTEFSHSRESWGDYGECRGDAFYGEHESQTQRAF